MVCSKELIKKRANELNLQISIVDYTNQQFVAKKNTIYLIDLELKDTVKTGILNQKNSSYVIKMLDIAIENMQQKKFSALVTAPVHKGIINKAGFNFTGHTEYLAKKTKTKNVAMVLANKKMKVALVTTHLALKNVAKAITKNILEEKIILLNNELKSKFSLKNPKIYICGLNPHAGDDGALGDEEINIISPVVKKLQQQNINLIGPLSADTIFSKNNIKDSDLFLAMYHDQGLGVLKYSSFNCSVNITLGLPFTRTSVDHGSALDLAGTGKVSISSLKLAIDYARSLQL